MISHDWFVVEKFQFEGAPDDVIAIVKGLVALAPIVRRPVVLI